MNKTLSAALSYRVAIVWFALFSINALCTSITAALVGSDWPTLDKQSKFMIVLAVAGNWTGTLMAFISKSAKKMEDGGNPLDITQSGDTTIIKKTDVQQTTVSTQNLSNSQTGQ